MDTFAKRYGWTFQQIADTPASVIEELSQVIRAESDYQNSKRNGQPMPAGSHEEMMRRARADGMPMPGGM